MRRLAKLQHLHVIWPMLNFCHRSKGNWCSFLMLPRKSVWRVAGLERFVNICVVGIIESRMGWRLFMGDMRKNSEITCVLTDG